MILWRCSHGKGSAMATFLMEDTNVHIPHRGEIGITSDEIATSYRIHDEQKQIQEEGEPTHQHRGEEGNSEIEK